MQGVSRTAHEMSRPEPILESLFKAIRSSEDTWYFPGHIRVPAELATSAALNDLGMSRWSPVTFATNRDALSALYDAIPGPLPKLFEQMLLSYRWLRVEIPEVRLLGNPPGQSLSGFQEEIMRDPNLYPVLFSHRLVEFREKSAGRIPSPSGRPVVETHPCIFAGEYRSDAEVRISK